ncbi:Integrase [Geodermatophilus siccatus]|uniref:Integrase n=2 Tax=Geodermatophilus siccatus TaxID=1137991 RepID=A0A1H0ARA5_9ACTN|nr:Integrase [Geodermatophilus siccatus]
MTAGMALVDAGHLWLEGIRRTDSGKSSRTIQDYTRTFTRHIDQPGEALREKLRVKGGGIRGLSLADANNTQRLRAFLQAVADVHGTQSAASARSVLSGILNLAVDNGTLPGSALKNVRAVASQKPRPPRPGREPRDTRRALTRDERARLLAYADGRAAEPARPDTQRKWQTAADLLAFMAGTGARVTEARALRWEDVDEDIDGALLRGTKSHSSLRHVDFNTDLAERLRHRQEQTGGRGYVFASPYFTGQYRDRETGLPLVAEPHERAWEQSNCAKALSALLVGAGFSWATPHCLRRTAATLAHHGGAPLVAIADQLGHADPSMTARVYLGRDYLGQRRSVAQHL